jgi:hypothetical protein
MKIPESFPRADNALRGYRQMGNLIRTTDKAALFDYYGHNVWIPIKLVRVMGDNEVWAPAWAVDSSKEYVK